METPVVTADVGGQKELVDDTCGRVVKNIQTAKDNFYDRNYSQEEIERYVEALLEVLENPNYEEMAKACREKVINGFSINDMVKKMDKEMTKLIDAGTSIPEEVVKNSKELYAQYLVIFNETDKRAYGIDTTNAKFQHLKDRLWTHASWRTFITFLQKTGIMKFAKRNGIDKNDYKNKRRIKSCQS